MTAARLSDQRIRNARAGSQMGILKVQVWYVPTASDGDKLFFFGRTKGQSKNRKRHHLVRIFRVMTSMTGTSMPVRTPSTKDKCRRVVSPLRSDEVTHLTFDRVGPNVEYRTTYARCTRW